jgi:hypothetical protein
MISNKQLLDRWLNDHPDARQVERKYAHLVSVQRTGGRKSLTFGFHLPAERRAAIRDEIDVILTELGGTPPVVPDNFK